MHLMGNEAQADTGTDMTKKTLTVYKQSKEYLKQVEEMHRDGERHCQELLKKEIPQWLASYMKDIEQQ